MHGLDGQHQYVDRTPRVSIQAVHGFPRLRVPVIGPCIIFSPDEATPLFPHGVTIVC